MTRPNSSAIDAALAKRLSDDADLTALLPEGVYFDTAPSGLRSFVLITLATEADQAEFGQRVAENGLYRVEATLLAASGDKAAAAADRIDALLENHDLVAEGYTCMALYREARFRRAEEETASGGWWYLHGGFYRVQMAPIWTAAAQAGKD